MKLEDIAVFIEKDQAIVPKEILSYHLPKAHSLCHLVHNE